MTMRRRAILAWAGLAPLVPRVATAQIHNATGWPTRPLHLVAGGAGSVTDIRARWLSERLGAALGQPVVVENQPAAGGNVAAAQVARAAPDGYTLLLIAQGVTAINPHLYSQPGYSPLTDFAPITRLGVGMLVLSVPSASPFQSVKELIARAKEKPGTLNYGSPGTGFPPHMASELFKRQAGVEATHIPYKGGGAMMNAVLGQQVDWIIEGLIATLPQVRGGRLRALAVTGSTRSPQLPDVPTLAESGVLGYEYIGWTGVAAPAGTPAAIVARLNGEIVRIAASTEGQRWFEASGAEAGTQTPAEFSAFIQAEYIKWGQLIRDAKLKLE